MTYHCKAWTLCMLKIRIIPTLLVKETGLVKGVGFNSSRRVGTILPAIKVYNTRQVDELIVVDILATSQNREPDYAMVEEFSSHCFVPLTVGGGIKTIDHIKQLLKAGADKVCINSTAFDNPDLIKQTSMLFGSQCIVVSIDAAKNSNNEYECYSHSGTTPTGILVKDWAQKMQEFGAGELLITSIPHDGLMQGYDLELISLVSSSVQIPVIASGGAGSYDHMYQAVTQAQASAVAAASIFHFTQQTPLEAKKYLGAQGLPVRNSSMAKTARTTHHESSLSLN